MKSSSTGLVSLHVAASAVPFFAGLLAGHSLILCLVAISIGVSLFVGLLSRALRVDDEHEMMRVALEPTDDEEVTLPQINLPVHEPATGVRHKVVDTSDVPKVVTWHGQRGRS